MRRVLTIAITLGLMTAAGAAGWWLRAQEPPPPRETVDPDPLTVPVEWGTANESVFGAATVEYGRLRTIRVDGGTVTAVGTSGTIVAEGESPIEIDLRPLFVLVGVRPTFRSLDLDSEGADVIQLQEALVRLGYDPGGVDGTFGVGTRQAWREFQTDRGVDPINQVLVSDIAFVPDLPARVGDVTVEVGDAAVGDVLTLTEPDPRVVVSIPASADVDSMSVATVELLVPGAAPLPATVTQIEPDAEGWVAILRAVDTDGLPVSFRARFTIRPNTEGLVIPSTALSTSADGATYVTVWDRETRESERVEVTVVSSSRTSVQVTGSLEVGDEVVVGS